MMRDLATGQARSADGEAAEDAILRLLLERRRRLAESELHAANRRAAASLARPPRVASPHADPPCELPRADSALAPRTSHSDDMHFESHFYSSVAFGLPEQTVALRDPNRLAYSEHGLTAAFRAADVEARLHARYGPAEVRAEVRARLSEPTAAAQLRREELVNWLAAHVPEGFMPSLDTAARRDEWLHGYCHDVETYALTDAALSFALCGMHVLQLRELESAAAADGAPASTSGTVFPHPPNPPTAPLARSSDWLLYAAALVLVPVLVAAAWHADFDFVL